jgi:hypothetical protein
MARQFRQILNYQMIVMIDMVHTYNPYESLDPLPSSGPEADRTSGVGVGSREREGEGRSPPLGVRLLGEWELLGEWGLVTRVDTPCHCKN